jgi:hypothetical protein
MTFQVVTAELSPHGTYWKRVSFSGEKQQGLPNREPQAGMPVPLCRMTFSVILAREAIHDKHPGLLAEAVIEIIEQL